MRIKEILPESWWKDLDPGFLSMMGYSSEETAPETQNADPKDIATDVKSVRSAHQPQKLAEPR